MPDAIEGRLRSRMALGYGIESGDRRGCRKIRDIGSIKFVTCGQSKSVRGVAVIGDVDIECQVSRVSVLCGRKRI